MTLEGAPDEQDDWDDDLFEENDLSTIFVSLQNLVLKSKPHIKEYKRIRKLHGEIIDSMFKFYQNGKFEQKLDAAYAGAHLPESERRIGVFAESSFDMETDQGIQAFLNVLIYKTAPNINCITEEYIRIKRYSKPEKTALLQSMLDSKAGLFEVTDMTTGEGYVTLKNVFTDETYRLTDIGLSASRNALQNYIYLRVITYQGISFDTGLNVVFDKNDPFIKSFIKRHKQDYKPLGELMRFLELHNRVSQNNGGITAVLNNL